MKKIFCVLVYVLALSSLSYANGEEEKLVKQAFESYKAAILNDEGTEAVKFVDSRTIKYFGDILNKSVHADSLEIIQASLMDKIMILSTKHRIDKKQLLSLDGEGFFKYAIEAGMVGKNAAAGNSIGEVLIDGKFAKGRIIAQGQETPLYFHFYKEGGEWKLNLTSIFDVSNMALKKMIQDSGKEEDEFILTLLEMTTGRKPARGIWHPLVD